MTIHHTKIEAAAVFAWCPLDAEWEVCAPALIDTALVLPISGRPYFARLNYDEAEAVAKREGGQLISSEQIETLRKVGVQLKPYLGTPQAENGIEHSRAHDENVWGQLVALGWTMAASPEKPVMGAGKHWVAGAPPGKSRLKGWDRDGAGPGQAYWQPDAVAHNRQHFDDGTTTLIVRRRVADTFDVGDHTIEMPTVDALASGFAQGARDIARDVAAWLTGPGLTPAHGARCAVWELHDDAVALGTWHPAVDGYVPKRGDLLLSARWIVVGSKRLLGDPTKGGNGHVEAVLKTDARFPVTLGGNENDTWIEGPFDFGDPLYRGCIERGALGEAAVEIALAEKASGVREVAGPKHNPRIQLYHACTRRAGSPLAGMPGHEKEGAATLGDKAADEVSWCASAASWCALQVLSGAIVHRDLKPENVSDDALFIPDSLTVATPAAVFEALRKAWPIVIGGEPKRESLLVLLSQWGIENADGASLHSWNLGNVKRVQGKAWTMRKGVWEMINGKRETFEPPHPQTHFRAFTSLEEGAVEYLRILSTRFAKSWPAVLAGDPAGFAHALKLQRYFSADEAAYTAAIKARFAQFERAIPGSSPAAAPNLDTKLGQTAALMKLGYAANVDFAAALLAFQNDSGISPPGPFGPKTRASVLAALSRLL